MLHRSIIPEPTMMKGQQQQECSEIHTIQIFREAPSSLPPIVSSDQDLQKSPEIPTTSLQIPELRDGEMDEISVDWAKEMDEEMTEIEQPSSARNNHQHYREGGSSLYSFYFETPIVSMTQDNDSEEYTIASDNTDSFRDNNALSLDGIDNIWEQGISNSTSANVDTPTSQSILGDTILGDKGR